MMFGWRHTFSLSKPLLSSNLSLRNFSTRFNIKKNPKNRMLFFSGKEQYAPNRQKMARTIQEIKKQVNYPGNSLAASIEEQAKRDESFNDFLKE